MNKILKLSKIFMINALISLDDQSQCLIYSQVVYRIKWWTHLRKHYCKKMIHLGTFIDLRLVFKLILTSQRSKPIRFQSKLRTYQKLSLQLFNPDLSWLSTIDITYYKVNNVFNYEAVLIKKLLILYSRLRFIYL